ncbi:MULTISPECIES: hypothetical protein [Serratia]|uniref:MrpH family fimbial adhesin n=1 Tax=Serratia TaxID=613 RepID=UPI0008A98A61|nr:MULTISPECIES: hypothetical protein [Serratia]APS33467.1 hypothetical protein RN42_06230 [Serratia marcescens]MBH2684234.1 hypothetical protein [Serratia marcescens]MBN5255163.1 hypothetical protein [Serratia marcescens]OHT41794.1 hypothetical protein BGV45_18660 [Serratia marcescens]OHT42754.1 hypothetical protein BGV46_18880 [Serratia marcescens]
MCIKIAKAIKFGVLFWLLFIITPVGNAINIQLALYPFVEPSGKIIDFSGHLYDWFGEDSRPNPCYRAGTCELGLQLYTVTASSGEWYQPYGNVSWFASGAWVSGAENLGDMGKAVRKNVNLPVERRLLNGIPVPTYGPSMVCLVYRANGGPTIQFTPGVCSASEWEGPTGTWCEPKGGAITFSYGVLESAAVNGQTRSALYSLWCNRTVTAKVYARNLSGGRLYLSADRRLYADLTIDGKELGTGVTQVFREGVESSYTIQSKLGSSGNLQGGDFSGSTVVYIDIQ